MSAYLFLAIGVIGNAISQLLMKAATADQGSGMSLWRTILRPVTVLAVALLSVGFLGYIAALRRLPLSVAYPLFLGGASVLVTFGSSLVFREALRPAQVAGIVLMLVALVLIGRN